MRQGPLQIITSTSSGQQGDEGTAAALPAAPAPAWNSSWHRDQLLLPFGTLLCLWDLALPLPCDLFQQERAITFSAALPTGSWFSLLAVLLPLEDALSEQSLQHQKLCPSLV